MAHLNQAYQDLDIHQPPRRKRLLQQSVQRWRGAEEFGAALRVIDGQVSKQRSRRREDASQVMAHSTAHDHASQQPDARPEDHLEWLI